MFSRTLSRQITMMLADILIVSLAFYFALLLRFDGRIPQYFLNVFQVSILFICLTLLVIFSLSGLYRKLWQYAGIHELLAIFKAVTLGMGASLVLTYLLNLMLPRTVYIIAWAFILLMVGGVRFVLRSTQSLLRRRVSGYCKKVLIVGAGEAGVMVANELERNRSRLHSVPVGFVDDDPKKKGSFIHQIPILGSREDIPRIIETGGIDEIIIAIPSASRKTIGEIVAKCKIHPVKVKILPGVFELLDGRVSLKKIRDVDVEDLLRREPVKVDLEEMAAYLQGQSVLVTGGGGSIGSELCRQILRFKPKNLLILGQGENSIYSIHQELKDSSTPIIPLIGSVQDSGRLEELFARYRPHVVFHAAAHKHVPLMEDNPREAIKNNIFGTKNAAEAAHRHHCRHFVLISTDKAVNPTSVMGATKRVAEMVVQAIAKKSSTKFCAVRFGNVLGSRGSVVPLFRQQISTGGPITVTHPDMVRYFMTIQEAVQLVIQAGAMGNRGEIFVLDMGEPVKIVALARDLIKLSGYEPNRDIDIVFTGIRRGEKLFEEVLTNQEDISSTKHEKIFIASANGLEEFLQELKNINEILEVDSALLASFIPGLAGEREAAASR